MNYVSNFAQALDIERKIKGLAERHDVHTTSQPISKILRELFEAINKKSMLFSGDDYLILQLAIHIRNALERPTRHGKGLIPLYFQVRVAFEYIANNMEYNTTAIKKLVVEKANEYCQSSTCDNNCKHYPCFEEWSKDAIHIFTNCLLGMASSVLEKWIWGTTCWDFTTNSQK